MLVFIIIYSVISNFDNRDLIKIFVLSMRDRYHNNLEDIITDFHWIHYIPSDLYVDARNALVAVR